MQAQQQPVTPPPPSPPTWWNPIYQALIRRSESKCGLVLKLILLIVMAYFIYHNISSWRNRNRADNSWCEPNVTVSLDGKGQFTAISSAVEAAPANSSFKYCIYIRRGVYRENVLVDAEKTNLVFVGDGMGKSVITSSRSSIDGFFGGDQIATLRILGVGFMGRDLTIENAAGPERNHGVALENWADQTVFYRSSFLGYRDTIYTSNGRQFYRDCHIQGTHYFISGDAQAVFQKCRIKAINLSPQEQIVISGQSRGNPTLKNGFVFHLCDISTVGTITMPPHTYLGGPVEAYAVTVVMQSFLDASIDPVGWLIDSTTAPTVFFGEYDNRGPGALTQINSPAVQLMGRSIAARFTVRLFLEGKKWLPSTVPHQLDLI
ncbi:hypothetical protein L1049_016413 [Liquidambar formosana]|uniref:Pectinesterase catalytic domain-containing protein n=1 Tax=Liquidambar formosana TaxID=63359 RepID=A0AAP0S1B8_LIQFO